MIEKKDTRASPRAQGPDCKKPREWFIRHVSEGGLADALGLLRKRLAALQCYDKRICDELIRRGINTATGQQFSVEIAPTVQVRERAQ
jgi:hypothetical protein